MNGSLIEIGLGATSLALVLSFAAIIAAGLAVQRNAPSFLHSARHALILNFILVTIGCFTIVYSFVVKDYSVLYVVQNSNSQLPLLYRLTALWGAHEGSLMLWLWFLAAFSALAVYVHWKSHPLSMPYVIITLAALQIGFLIFILFLSNPFIEVHPAMPDGRDLNPLLQDPGLAFHPPTLYMGYVGFSIPFAFAIAALVRGQSGREWVVTTRRWTLFSWVALTSGILLGGYWAYYELGWGGYWAWDPVENASLMPWLTGTAFLHSIMAQDQRNLFQTWNVFLIITTFALSLLGTFLVRSGVLTSVHSFAADPGRGAYILVFLIVVSVAAYGLLVWRGQRLIGPHKVSNLVSRESALLYNNLMFVAAAVIVLTGTLYPLAIEVLTGERVSVAAPYFNKVMAPLMLGIVLLMGLGPLVPWRKSSLKKMRDQFALPAGLAALVAIASGFLGATDVIALLAIGLVAFVFIATLLDVIRAVKAHMKVTDRSFGSSLTKLAASNQRRYGGFIVHMGTLVLIIGVIGSAFFKEEATVTLSKGEQVSVGPYTMTFQSMIPQKGPNYSERMAFFEWRKEDGSVGVLNPSKRNYPVTKTVTTEAAILSTLLGDLYVVLGNETKAGAVVTRAYWNPLVNWIWIGWMVILAGVLFAMTKKAPKIVTKKRAETESPVGGAAAKGEALA